MATATLDNDKIVLRGYTPELVRFYHTLPRARFDRAGRCWRCDATLGAYLRIRQHPNISIQVTDDSWRIAEQAIVLLSSDKHEHKQPPFRRTEAHPHQIEAYNFCYHREAALLYMAMRTGKTKVVIDLIQNWEDCRKVLVLCPKSAIDVWDDEIVKHAIVNPQALFLRKGSVAKRTEAARQWFEIEPEKPHIAVINYDSARMEPFASWSLNQKWDLVVLDESHRIKSASGKTSRYAAKLGCVTKRRLCLTGTPMPHSPADIFGQFRFLDPGLFGTSWLAFRDQYAVMGGYENKQIVEFRNTDTSQVTPFVSCLDGRKPVLPQHSGHHSLRVLCEM